MNKWSPTNHLVRYLEHMSAKGGNSAKMAENVNNTMKYNTKFDLLRSLTGGKVDTNPSKAVDRLANDLLPMQASPDMFRWNQTEADYPGVSSKQISHVKGLLRSKQEDLGNFKNWTDLGQPAHNEIRDIRHELDDHFNDLMQENPKSKEMHDFLSNSREPYQALDRLKDWIKRRGYK